MRPRDPSGERRDDDLPVVDLDVWTRRQTRREAERLRTRRRRHRLTGAVIGAVAGLALAGGVVAWAVRGHDGGSAGAPVVTVASDDARQAPVGRVREAPGATATTDTEGSDASRRATPPARARSGSAPAGAAAGAGGGAARAAAGTRPVVWVQAGHVAPGEPGYLAQTGAGGGPFGSEQAFNSRTQAALVAWLAAHGVTARATPALVTPWGADGAVFVSVHFDSPGGGAAIGHATSVPGRHENYYNGQGTGTASPTPYADSAAHRPHTEVTPAVEAASTTLAEDIAARYRSIFTAANGAGSRFRGVEPRGGNVRMTHLYGYYRTNAAARVLIECGAAGADDAFLARTDLIAATIGRGITDYLGRS